MNTILRKSVLTLAGLTFAGGVVAGPATGAHAAPHTPAASASVVQADKPGKDKLIPHGTQGNQSRINLSDEQQANAKAIIAATKKRWAKFYKQKAAAKK